MIRQIKQKQRLKCYIFETNILFLHYTNWLRKMISNIKKQQEVIYSKSDTTNNNWDKKTY